MHLYSLTLQKATAINKVVYGSFSHPKSQELAVSKGKILELLRPDENGKLITICSQEIYGIIRSLAIFRLTGNNRDYLVIGSDSGRIVILFFDNEKNIFEKVHMETFGKTGCRRIVPGQYLACDPKGRAIMISAIEKQKFVYILNRDGQNKLTISSPLEAHKSHTIVFDTVSVDVGYENPLFAVLEVDYGDQDQQDSAINTGEYEKMITFYEMDLGLNHVIRKHAEVVPNSAHMLIPVPGLPDGPGGVLVCCENLIVYKQIQKGKQQQCALPIRIGQNGNLLINSFGAHRQKDLFFFLLQTEIGDIFKLQLSFTKDEVHLIQISYFDSIPVANSLCVLKSGYLFAASEFGNHNLYSIIGLGEDNQIIQDSSMNINQPIQFYPRALKNLQVQLEIENMATITDIKVADLTNEGNQQIYTLCSANHRSTLRILRHGLAISEMAVSDLPAIPLAIWTIKDNLESQYHKYIVLSFTKQTLVLSVGEKVTEVNDSGLDLTKSTIFVSILEDGTIIQVIPNGIRQIKRDKRINQWQTEGRIIKAAANPRQLVIALEGGEVIYFELDQLGQMVENEKINLDAEVVTLDIGQVPEDMQRCKFLIIGLADFTVKLYSLDPETCLQRLGTQALPALPESVCLLEMTVDDERQIFLNVGLNNGVLLKTVIDNITGNLTDTRTRFLGSKPVKLFKITINKQDALLALSSRPWVFYNFQGNQIMVPLSYETMEYASSFCSSECQEGIVGISGYTLRIITPERLGEVFNQTIIPLRYNPRKIQVSINKFLIITETSHKTYNWEQNQLIKQQIYKNNPECLELSENQIGPLKAPEGTWAACIRIFSPQQNATIELYELQENETIVSQYICQFPQHENQEFLFIGIAKDLKLQPKSFSACFVDLYKLQNNGTLELVHRTQVEQLPLSFHTFRNNILIGVGTLLRMYEVGKKKLLKKSENRNFTGGVINIQSYNERIFVSDIADSIHIFKFKPKDSSFFEIADDTLPRWITSVQVLDYQTICGADKFENFFVLRLPMNLDEEILQDSVAYKNVWDIGKLNGAPYKFSPICNMFVGEVICSMQKTSLVNTANEVIIYCTSMGSIGAFYPFETKEDVDFFIHLEMFLRQEHIPLGGRDHISFRSSFIPVKATLDGDLCEEFARLSFQKQKQLGEELDRTPSEIQKKLEDIRNKIL